MLTKTKMAAAALFAITLVSCSENNSPDKYRDLNKNGKKDIYEDAAAPIEDRVTDLLGQMNLEEKAGLMFINGARVNDDGSIDDKPGTGFFAFAPNALNLAKEHRMNSFNIWAIPSNASLAKWYNGMQRYLQDSTRLGIPMLLASDPRNHFSNQLFAVEAEGFTQWCEPLGLAAIGDADFVKKFADISRQEYLAVGIRECLHPQIDLATEPRWPRISGSFGEDAELTAKLAKAYILGYQGETLSDSGIACMTKHFPGGGPQREGLDPHFPFQRGQVYPGKNFDYHLIPFEAAFEANTSAIMPYYGVPTGQTAEDVGFAYNKAIITDLLRNKYHFDGVVCTDWGLVTDAHLGPVVWPARAWGVEALSEKDRVKKIIEAGCDQFGGENCTEHIVTLVKENQIPESRIDESVRRILRQRFQLGLFDNPFVDETKLSTVFSNPDHKAAALSSQTRSLTLLKNEDDLLPLQKNSLKIYVEGMNKELADKYATVVDDPSKADLAILRLKTPWIPVETDIPLAKGFHHGDLDFKGSKKDSILRIVNSLPTIVDIYLDRPAVIPEISAASKALVGNFGSSDEALLMVLFGEARPEGRLPFELPASMEAVREQKEDLPHDSKMPLYAFGAGLRYK